MPIIFALQNPTLATSLEATIKWKLWEGNNRSSLGSIGGGHFDVAGDVATEHLTSSDPYLVSGAVNTVAYPDGFWTLAWSLEYNNCSSLINGETFFTVFKSGQAPNLVAATSTDVCDTTMPKHSI